MYCFTLAHTVQLNIHVGVKFSEDNLLNVAHISYTLSVPHDLPCFGDLEFSAWFCNRGLKAFMDFFFLFIQEKAEPSWTSP